MVRPRKCRRIFFKTQITYFKPRGIPLRNLEEVVLTFDEIEAIRLVDYEGIEQKEAANKMRISQPTLSRLLLSARKKISSSLIEGKAIKIEGGNFILQKEGKKS
ncbi:MAG: DUF134 domain-containing protein [Candidatus Pacearchaeota archaeon]